MRTLVVALSAAALLAQAALGCCWQHLHAWGLAAHVSSASASCCDDCDDAQDDHRQHSSPDKPQDSHTPCGHWPCVFVAGQTRTAIDGGAAPVSPLQLLDNVSVTLTSHVHVRTDASAPGVFLPSVRLHLVHRVLLI